ncbi:MAG: hypothetical protein OXC72_14900 [Roseovarius sp.]|nr:hypothetical protein [Roseovarius sp.]MCY4293025.1 hypothetical protein [Roseovarius sp.]
MVNLRRRQVAEAFVAVAVAVAIDECVDLPFEELPGGKWFCNKLRSSLPNRNFTGV